MPTKSTNSVINSFHSPYSLAAVILLLLKILRFADYY